MPYRRYAVLMVVLAFASAAVLAVSTKSVSAADNPAHVSSVSAVKAHTAAVRWLSGKVYAYQQKVRYWQRLTGHPLSPTKGRVLAAMSIPDIQKSVAYWRHQATLAREQARHPPHLRQFLCIHHYEAGWTDTGAPYYGGLQMDLGFQQSYGGWLYAQKGTANHWTPLEQIWVAEKALKSRGFWPWPNTARFCGLL